MTKHAILKSLGRRSGGSSGNDRLSGSMIRRVAALDSGRTLEGLGNADERADMHWTSPQMRSGLGQWRTKHAVVIRTIRQR